MSRDSGAHRSRAEHHNLFDATFHGWPFFSDLYERTGYKTNIHGSIELTQTALTHKLVTACLNLSFRACCAGGWTKKSVFCPVESPVYTNYRCVQKLAWRWLGASLGASRISECCAFCATQAFTLTRWQAPAWAR